MNRSLSSAVVAEYFKKPEFLLFLMILIPLSVDGNFSIGIGHYDLRIPYLGCVGLLALMIWETVRRKNVPPVFNFYLGLGFWKWFLWLLPIGIAGSIFSTNVERSALFTIWTVGTLTFVPFAVLYLYRKLGNILIYGLLGYACLQALLIWVDAGLCIPTNGRLHLGKVMVYDYRAHHELCRPHAWYQEPGYFCGFGILVAFLARTWITRSGVPKIFKTLALTTYILILGAMLMTLSRLGWIGMGIFVLFEIFDFFRGRRLKFKPLMLLPASLIAALFYFEGNSIYRHSLEGLVRPFEDSSILYRLGRTSAAWSVFKKNIWVGAGPGAAGAYLVDRLPDHPWLAPRGAEERSWLRHDPLSQSFYTEILSEWGVFGFVAFFGGVVLWLWNWPWPYGPRAVLLFGLLALSTQTVPRFDLWWVLGTLWVGIEFGSESELKKRLI